jgi:phage-related protein
MLGRTGELLRRDAGFLAHFRSYKFLYTIPPHSASLVDVADSSPPDVVFEGNSRDVIRKFPKDVRENFGGELRRLQINERPLDSGPMAPAIPGVFELRDKDKDFWYRVLYYKRDDVVYVLHCFTKKTNATSPSDIRIGRRRLSDLKQRLEKTKKN